MNGTDFRYLHPRLTAVIQWLTFFALLLSIWLVTQDEDAPQLILLGLLIIIGVNLSLPLSANSVGIVPLVATSSLFILGDPVLVVGLFVISYTLVETVRPFWYGSKSATHLKGASHLQHANSTLPPLSTS